MAAAQENTPLVMLDKKLQEKAKKKEMSGLPNYKVAFHRRMNTEGS
jgi:hypothetical protein